MTLNGLYVIPHGDEILSMPNPESRVMNTSIQKMTKKDCSKTVAIISPHGLRLPLHVSIIATERARGNYPLGSGRLKRSPLIDRGATESLLTATGGFTEKASFITASGPLSVFPLDFGALIPFTFFPGRKLIYMGQPRPADSKSLVEFGRKLYRWIESYKEEISMVFSADQAHTHSPGGPYGYSPSAKEYDLEIRSAIDRNNFRRIVDMSEKFISEAKPDSYWNMLILYGFLQESGLKMVVRYYYVQEYFGMLSACTDG